MYTHEKSVSVQKEHNIITIKDLIPYISCTKIQFDYTLEFNKNKFNIFIKLN